MKKILILIVVLMASMPLLTAQDFHITEKGIIWMNTYETDMNSTELLKALYVANIASEIIPIDETMIVGKMRPISYSYKTYNLSWGKTAIYFRDSNLGPAFFIMQMKEGRYRIILQNISLQSKVRSDLNPYGSLTPLEYYAVDEYGYSESFQPYGDIYEDILKNAFTLSKISEEW